MSEGVFTMPLVEAGAGAFAKLVDQFQRLSSGTAVGTAGVLVSAKPGRMYRATIQNGGATAYFLQFFNKATAPVNTDVPVHVERLPVSGEVKVDLTNVNGLVCPLGIGLAISTTAGVLTLAGANDIAFLDVFYTASQ